METWHPHGDRFPLYVAVPICGLTDELVRPQTRPYLVILIKSTCLPSTLMGLDCDWNSDPGPALGMLKSLDRETDRQWTNQHEWAGSFSTVWSDAVEMIGLKWLEGWERNSYKVSGRSFSKQSSFEMRWGCWVGRRRGGAVPAEGTSYAGRTWVGGRENSTGVGLRGGLMGMEQSMGKEQILQDIGGPGGDFFNSSVTRHYWRIFKACKRSDTISAS